MKPNRKWFKGEMPINLLKYNINLRFTREIPSCFLCINTNGIQI